MVITSLLSFVLGYFVAKCGRHEISETRIPEKCIECAIQPFWVVDELKGKLHSKNDCGPLRSRSDVMRMFLCEHALSKRELCKKCK